MTLNESIRVRDLFHLPDPILKGDLARRPGDGAIAPAETARAHVITPALADALDRALQIVGGALGDGRSRAACVHGSLGSGKSHFMALLGQLLEGHEAVWAIPELRPLRAAHPWAGVKRLLQLHFDTINQPSLDVAIFDEYMRHVRSHHPSARIPALFADDALFEDARRLLQGLGDAAFFAPMNEDASASTGDRAQGGLDAGQWQRASFEAAASSTDPKERARLFDAIARTHFKAFVQQSRAFLDLDAGLAVMAGHAATLGFEGIALYLDDLVPWLGAGADGAPWLHGEARKVSELAEARARGPIPIVSFLARPRDVVEMVGEELAGAESARLRDLMGRWEGRVDTITLDDRSLPAIAERRALRPRNAEAKLALDDAFATMRRAAGVAFSVLSGSWDDEAFRRLYPFSPALVEILVAVSNAFQRRRTAMDVMREMLADHIPDLETGGLVPVGDLFDALAVGDDPVDGVMRARFDAARHLYRDQLLPAIHAENGTGAAARCQRLRPDHRANLGCSGCPELACRNDNRLLKTLLLAALVPETLGDLRVSRLVQLNHGAWKAPTQAAEASLAAQRLTRYAGALSQIRIGSQEDPRVAFVIRGADVEAILEQAGAASSALAQQQLLRDLLFEAIGVDKPSGDKATEWGQDHVIEWRTTRRLGHIRFGNVRRLVAEILRCPEPHEWRLVIDYPFDEPGHGPGEDLDAIAKVRAEGEGTWTLVWLPSFFSEPSRKLLGELAVLERLLGTSASLQACTQHLTAPRQHQAQLDLQNLRSEKRARLTRVIAQAYGLARPSERDIDPSRSVASHLHALKPGAEVPIALAAGFDGALESLIPALLAQRYPRHPLFTRKLTRARIARLYDLFGALVDSHDKQLYLDKDTIEELGGTLGALGLVRTTATAVHLTEDPTLQAIERRRQLRSMDHPTAAEVRGLLDDSKTMGLEPKAADLVVRLYARWAMRALVRHGRAYEAQAGAPLPDDVVLEKSPLPEPGDWSAALESAGAAFGITLREKALHADNLKRFEAAITEALGKYAVPCVKLPGLLAARLGELGLPGACDRATTAACAGALCGRLARNGSLGQVRVLAELLPETSGQALGRSVATAAEVGGALDNKLIFGAFQQVKARGAALRGGPELLEEVGEALRRDELHAGLAAQLRALAERAHEMLGAGPGSAVPRVAPVGTSAPPPASASAPAPASERVSAREWLTLEKTATHVAPGTARERLRALLGEIEAQLADSTYGEVTEVMLTVRARFKR